MLRRCVRPIRVLAPLALVACAGPQRPADPALATPAGAKSATADGPATALTRIDPAAVVGTWDWIFRSTTQQGDPRIEQEEWHLELGGRTGPAGTPLRGEYLRQVLTLSGDRQPFRCNGRLGFLTQARVRLTGLLRGDELVLREVSREAPRQPPADPCDSGEPPLTTYAGRLAGDTLRLVFRDGAVQHLQRRPPGQRVPPLSDELAASPTGGAAQPAAPASLTGTWRWQHRSQDPDGDTVLEEEVWRLSEQGIELSGTSERTVTRSRAQGTFRCNRQPELRTVTRFTLRGQRFGARVHLSELAAEAPRGPCDNGQRRLDHYQGTLLPDGTLLLSAGSGHQILRRAD